MNELLRAHADAIIASSIEAVKPDEAVARALKSYHPHGGKTLLVAAGKAAWQMAAAAAKVLPEIDGGVVVTKYGHVLGDIPGVVCCEGGHPVPDEGSFAGTRKALALVANLTAEDSVSIAEDLGNAEVAYLSINNKVTFRSPVDRFGHTLPRYFRNAPVWVEYREQLMTLLPADAE